MDSQRGFTLIELMIVVAIIAILAAIAVSQYQDYVIRAQVSEASTLADGVKTSIVEYQSNYGTYPANNSVAGLATASSIVGSYVSSVDIGATTGQIQITFSSNAPQRASGVISGKTMIFSAVRSSNGSGTVSWICKSSTMQAKWLPSVCR